MIYVDSLKLGLDKVHADHPDQGDVDRKLCSSCNKPLLACTVHALSGEEIDALACLDEGIVIPDLGDAD